MVKPIRSRNWHPNPTFSEVVVHEHTHRRKPKGVEVRVGRLHYHDRGRYTGANIRHINGTRTPNG